MLTSPQNYRYWVLHVAPQIRFLDFQKVKDVEREKATELFGTTDNPTELTKSVLSVRSNNPLAFSAPTMNGTTATSRMKLTDVEKKKIEQLIRNAASLADVQRLEKALNEGRIPAGVLTDGAMDET